MDNSNIIDTNVKEFDWVNELDEKFCIVCVAPRKTGKNYLVERVLEDLHNSGKWKWEVVFLFSETSAVNEDAFPMISPEFKYESLNEEILDRIFETQEKIKKSGNEPPPVLIILDDVANDPKLRYSKSLTRIPVSGRHFNIYCIALFHRLVGVVSPKYRENCDYLIFFKSASRVEKQWIADNLLSLEVGMDRKQIYNFMDNIYNNDPHRVMVIDKTKLVKANSLTDYIFTYKAPERELGEVQLGDERHWRNVKKKKKPKDKKRKINGR